MNVLRARFMSRKCRIADAILLFALCSIAAAESTTDVIRAGNEHFAAGRYAEALETYKNLGAADPDAAPPELLHDMAAAHFKLGQIDEARELWVRAATRKDERFEAQARYNLGNCNYAEALRAVEAQDAKKARELLDKAVDQYRHSIRLDPSLANARANLELAEKLKQEIDKQSTTQPQSQQSSQQSSQSSSGQSSQPSSQQQSSSGESGDQSENSSSSSQPTSQQQQPSSQEQEEQEPDSQPASQPQPQPQSQPAEAQSQPDEKEGEGQEGQELHMTREEAERLLQKIRDAERARRMELMRRAASKYKPVDRDW